MSIKRRKRASARVMGFVPQVGRIDTAASRFRNDFTDAGHSLSLTAKTSHASMHCKCDAGLKKAIAAAAIGHRL